MTLSGRVKFSKCLADAARVEGGFFRERGETRSFSSFRFRIFAYSVYGRLSQVTPDFLEVAAIGFEKVLTFFAKTI